MRGDGLADRRRHHLWHASRPVGPQLHLHAREIVVPLYKNKPPVTAMAPAPLHMQERLYACGWQGEVFTLVD